MILCYNFAGTLCRLVYAHELVACTILSICHLSGNLSHKKACLQCLEQPSIVQIVLVCAARKEFHMDCPLSAPLVVLGGL